MLDAVDTRRHIRPRARPVMLAAVLRGLQSTAGLSDRQWSEFLARVALTPADLDDETALVPLESGLRAFDLLVHVSGRPDLALHYARAFPIGGTGALGFALVSARTVREALQTLARFMPLVTSMRISRYTEDATQGGLAWQYAVAPTVPRFHLAAWGVALVIGRLTPALPHGWKPLAVEFEEPAPADRAAFVSQFGPGVAFGRPIHRLVLQREVLDRPMPDSSERLHGLMTRLATLEQTARGASGSAFEDELKAQLAELIRSGKSRLEDLAVAVGRSSATLSAELKAHNSDFKALLNDVRRSTALAYLMQTDLSITEITFALGYSDCSIFTRACRKWFGKPPRDVRRDGVLKVAS